MGSKRVGSELVRRCAPYPIAIGFTGTALLLSLGLQPYLTRTIGAFFYIAVICSTWAGGLCAGTVSVMLSTLAINYFFVPPIHQFVSADPEDGIRLGIFALTALVINLLSSNLRHSKHKIEQLSQQLVQESNHQLRIALTAAQMGMWDWNLITDQIVWSPEHEQLFGFAPGTFDGRYQTFEACLHPDDRLGLEQAIQVALQHRTIFQYEFRVIWADGSVHWMEGRGQAFYDPVGQPLRMMGTVMAIDDRKQAETALRQSEERWQLAIAGSNDGIWDHDLITNRQFLSPRCLEIVGYALAEVNTFDRWLFLVHPDDRLLMQTTFQRHLRQHSPKYACEYRIRCQDGQYRWVLARGQSLWNQAGVPIRAVGSLTDITEQKQAEAKIKHLNAELEQRVDRRTAELAAANNHLHIELFTRERMERALQESELRFRALFDQSSRVIALVQPDGILFEQNQLSRQLTAQTGETIVGRRLWELAGWGTANQSLIKVAFEQALAGEVAHLELDIHEQDDRLLKTPEGHPVTHNITLKAVKNMVDQVMFLTIEGWDISQLRQAEASLREFNRRWRSLLNTVQLVVIELNMQGTVEYANPFFLQLTGYSPEAVVGEYWFDRFLSPGQQPAAEVYFRAVLDDNFQTHYQSPILTQAGEERMIAWNNTLLRDRAGQPIGTISIGEDITERYQLDRMKAEFISVVSHELRTPLTSMQAALSLLVEKIIDPNSEEGETIIQIAAAGVDRLVRLVNDILDLERLDSGRMRLEKQRCNINQIITIAVEQMQEMAHQAGVRLQISVPEFEVEFEVIADADRLLQVLINLISNGIKFSAIDSTVKLAVGWQGPWLQFTVQDQGRGIPSDQLESIFERFQQVDASDSRAKGGTGLGLAICRTIIQQHGGQIWAESSSEGSTFYFTLPIAEETCHDP
jgi:PAS domain S-box-containing protein